MSLFDKPAFKASMKSVADSILARAKKITVDNAAMVEGNNFLSLRNKISTYALGIDKLAVGNQELDLSQPDNGLTILLTGTPSDVRTKLGKRGCYSVRGSCISLYDASAPTLVPLEPHLPRRGYDDGDKRGLLEIDVVNLVVYRKFTVLYYEIADDKYHHLTYSQQSKSNTEWSPWQLVSGAGSTYALYDFVGPGGSVLAATPIAKRFHPVKVSGAYSIMLESDASINANDDALHPVNAEYVFIGVSGGGVLSFQAYNGDPITITTPAGKQAAMDALAGKVVTLQRIAPDSWLLTGDLKSV